MSYDFRYGLIYGAIAGGIIGFIFFQIRAARTRMGRRNRPLDNFTDAEQPQMTSWGVVRNSIFSMFGCLFWSLALIVAIVLLFVWPFR
ncbi:MAG: hypothetical protein ABSF99_12730 [Anaerolineales bacterium]|jgi:hypothetical protein